MGAWGEKAFQNDSALDWLAELETGGVATLRNTLSAVATAGPDEYVDVDDGSRAIAAAQVVAVALGLRPEATPAVRAWLAANPKALVAKDRQLAYRAVKRVLAEQSELNGLWGESGAESAWHADTRALLAELRDDTTPEAETASTPPKPARDSFKREKQVLFTVLGARGLEPTSEQRARIEASRDVKELHRWLSRAWTVTTVAELFDE